MIGSTIGHYKIEKKLGEGGMGVVYEAIDTKLDRIVALKFLPDRVQKDSEAKARFIQEAQAAAGLNHPNICTIHGVDEVDGQLFMVMEYVEGGSLGERIENREWRIGEVVGIASQIAQALQKAHEKGIVHRDVKADNIMLTADGQAKVMDFGLAKLKGALKLTRTSSTVGTLGYMAPEQIQGGSVDPRSDIFSFGVLLFELLTGKLPFRGEHEAAMVYSIVNEEPQDIAALQPDLSPLVVNLIQRCLEKDPQDRYQTMQDVVSELRRSQKKTSRVMKRIPSVPPSDMAAEPLPSSDRKTSDSSIGPVLAAGGILLLAVALVSWFILSPGSPRLNPNPTVRTLTPDLSSTEFVEISRDGKWLAFSGKDAAGDVGIYIMDVETQQLRKLTSVPAEGWQQATISPDGASIVFLRTENGETNIATMSVLGGPSRTLVRKGIIPSWQPNGERIAFARSGFSASASATGHFEIWSVRPDGSDERLEMRDTVVGSHRNLSFDWSPDGEKFVFLRFNGDRGPVVDEGEFHELVVHNRRTREEKTITHDKAIIDEVRWADNGMIFFSSTRGGPFNVWMTDEDGSEIVPVTRGDGNDLAMTVASDRNRLVYYSRKTTYDIWRVSLDGSETVRLTSHGKAASRGVAVSPDGSSIIYLQAKESQDEYTPFWYERTGPGSGDLVRIGRNGENPTVIVPAPDKGALGYPAFSPDRQHAFYTYGPEGFSSAYGEARIMLLAAPEFDRPVELGSKGAAIFWYDASTIGLVRPSGTYLLDIRTKLERPLYLDTEWTALPVLNNRYVTLWKFAGGGFSGTLLRLDQSGHIIAGPERRYASFDTLDVQQSVVQPSAHFYADKKNQVWKIDYLTGKRTRVYGFTSEMTPGIIRIGNDGNTLVFRNSDTQSKLVMIEGVFEE